MSKLSFSLKIELAHRLNMGKLTPEQLQGKSIQEIAKITLPYANDGLSVGEIFTIRGDNAQHIVFEQSSHLMDNIGQGMQSGKIEIHGDVGHYLGLNMRGEIELYGNAGNFAACQMQAGLIRVHGNVGDYAGGALIGNRRGMRGGMLIVNGHAGDRLGDQMRRGSILIDGDAGDYCAANMLAGTIAVAGKIGDYCGYGMRHGTVILLDTAFTRSMRFHPTIMDVGHHNLAFLKLLLNAWQGLPSRFARQSGVRAHRWMGDIACDGKGEILILQN